tara:strand:- start:1225 stop:1338 length:114 start_codon:yes stop_codon:yes gene_type:complete
MKDNQGKREDQVNSYERLSAMGFIVFTVVILIFSIFF